jgi:hypothetical protein
MFEIYLPKKLEYQSELYATLRDGHSHEKVTEWLLHRQEHVRPLLPPLLRHAFGRRLETRHRVYYGFSMYEVDGVFFDGETPMEDRTQVLRLILYPDYKRILEELGEDTREIVMEHGAYAFVPKAPIVVEQRSCSPIHQFVCQWQRGSG